MTITNIIPINFEMIVLSDNSLYFRTTDGKWYLRLGDKQESSLSDHLEAAYQAYKAALETQTEHPELP